MGSWFWTLTSMRRATCACSVPLYLPPDPNYACSVPLYLLPDQDEDFDALQHISLCPVLLREIAVP